MPAYELTLGDARNDPGIRSVSRFCNTSEEFAEVVNAVTRRLLRRGNWFGTEVLMRICFEGCRIVWPREIGTVLGMRPCHSRDVQIKNSWWSIVGPPSCGWCGNVVMRDDNPSPCYREITGNDGKFIKWHITKVQDVGRTIRLYGFRFGGQPLQEQLASGEWIPGITITATQAGAQTVIPITKITSVKIPTPLQGMSYLYQVDQTTGDLLDLASYQPGETSPSYRTSKINPINSLCATEDQYGRYIRQADALVKLRFVPALVDEDFILISNLDALALAISALNLEQANDDAGAEIKMQKCVRELNLELRDKNPGMQTVVRVDTGGFITNPI
jgi:hypothetical protein